MATQHVQEGGGRVDERARVGGRIINFSRPSLLLFAFFCATIFLGLVQRFSFVQSFV